MNSIKPLFAGPLVKVSVGLVCSLMCEHLARAGQPLPSWYESATKTAIIDFVRRFTDKNSPDSIPVDRRIASFDNDGTLWSEQTAYF